LIVRILIFDKIKNLLIESLNLSGKRELKVLIE